MKPITMSISSVAIWIGCILLAATGCSSGGALRVSSTAFDTGQPIPSRYTCDGENVSPPLSWTGVPASARTMAVVCDDPDAPGGTFVHWVIYGLPATAGELPEGVPNGETVSTPSARQGRNDFHKLGYGGPCPPPGEEHRYVFRVYALDQEIALEPGSSKAALEGAIDGHILATGELTATYRRK